MADIQLNTFEKQRFYKIDNTLAHILVALGLAGPIEKQTPQPREDKAPPAEPRFSIVMGPQGTAVLELHLPSGERRYFNNEVAAQFHPTSKQWANAVRDAFKTRVYCGTEKGDKWELRGPEPSAEIIEEYRNIRKKLAEAAEAADQIKMQNEAIKSRRPFGE